MRPATLVALAALLATLLGLLAPPARSAPAKPPAKPAAVPLTPLTLPTPDGKTVRALCAAAPGAANAAVFTHMLGSRKEQWQPLMESAYRQGISSCAPDLRGHGENPAMTLAEPDYFQMGNDVLAAVNHLRSQKLRVALVGASIGANLSLRVAADDPAIAAAALLSPGLEYHGVTARDAIARYGKRPLLIVTGAADGYSDRSSRHLDQLATGEHRLIAIPGPAHGTDLLSVDPTLPDSILGFLRLSFAAPAP